MPTPNQAQTAKPAHTFPRIQVDGCPDANGFTTLREYDGTDNGNTAKQPIATVYEKHGTQKSDFIVTACNSYASDRAEIKALRSFAESVAAWCIAPDKSPESFAHFEQQARALLARLNP